MSSDTEILRGLGFTWSDEHQAWILPAKPVKGAADYIEWVPFNPADPMWDDVRD